MVNIVTFKVVLRKDQKNSKGLMSVVAQCFVNGKRVVITLGIHIEEKYFDSAKEFIKATHPDAIDYNELIADARSKAIRVRLEANLNNIQLNADNFRSMFTLIRKDQDFIAFYNGEMKKKVGSLEKSTLAKHKQSLKKLQEFKSNIPFSQLTVDLLSQFEGFLRAKGNNVNTIYGDLKNVRTYLYIAIKKGIEVKNPFLFYKVVRGGSKVVYCELEEQKTLLRLYDNHEVPEAFRISLLAFLVSCFVSLRISDIKRLKPDWVKDDKLIFLPQKGKRFNRYVNVPLSQVAKRLLADFFAATRNRKLKESQNINDDLKVIAGYARIDKVLSMHVGRHTFATTFLLLGGRVEVLQQLMGHRKITDTMIYVHIVDTRKRDQMDNFDKEFQ
jgi:integrase/recombinase XerD